MGEVVSATCRCGFIKKEMLLGGGFDDFDTSCNYPHYCNKCNSFFEANIYHEVCCADCSSLNIVRYGNKESYEQKGDRSVFEWIDLVLTNGKYYCPSCNKYELEFSSWGDWD